MKDLRVGETWRKYFWASTLEPDCGNHRDVVLALIYQIVAERKIRYDRECGYNTPEDGECSTHNHLAQARIDLGIKEEEWRHL